MTVIYYLTVPEDADICDEKPCQNGGTCESYILGHYFCSCPEGFVGMDCEEGTSIFYTTFSLIILNFISKGHN